MLSFPFLNLFDHIVLRHCNFQNPAGTDEVFLWLSFFYIYMFMVFYVLYLCAFCKLKHAICAPV